MTAARRIVALALACALGGCSVVAMETLPGGYNQRQTPRCSDKLLPVAGDVGWAALMAAMSVTVLAVIQDEDRTAVNSLATTYALTGAGFTASALLGRSWRRECIAARREHQRWLHEVATQPGYPWPPAAPVSPAPAAPVSPAPAAPVSPARP